MEIDKTDIDELSAAYSSPALLNPVLRDESIDQEVEMRVPVLLEFKDPDIRDRNPKLPLNIRSPLREGLVDVRDRVFRTDQLWIKSQSHEPIEVHCLSQSTNRPLILSSLAGAAITAVPALTIDPVKPALSIGRGPHDCESPAVLISPV